MQMHRAAGDTIACSSLDSIQLQNINRGGTGLLAETLPKSKLDATAQKARNVRRYLQEDWLYPNH